MPLSIMLTVCLAAPGYPAPHCDIRIKHLAETTNQEVCVATTQRVAADILADAEAENLGSKGFSLGQCFDRKEFAERVNATNEWLAERGYTAEMTFY